jgi:hypothetical protein
VDDGLLRRAPESHRVAPVDGGSRRPRRHAYKKLLAAVIERGKAEEHVTRAVTELREAGGSWNLIGPGLGVSRQSAREKYALADDNS